MFYINTITHGGAERVLVNLATKLSERGHECVLVTSFPDKDSEYPLGEKVQRISLSEERILSKFSRNIKYISALRQQVVRHRPDILIAFLPEANHRALLATAGLKTKCLISVRNDPNKEYRSKLSRIFAKLHYRAADGVVFQTEDAKRWFPKSIQNKSRIIINQVDEIFYTFHSEELEKDIVATGRLSKQKNHELLINAYAKIAPQISDRLLIYGSGGLKDALQQQIDKLELTNKVVLMGNTKNVPMAVGSAKLYVMSSDYEGMPNALMEAMALGVPCISTDCPCGGPKALFGKDLLPCLVPTNDIDRLASKMIELLNNERLRRSIGAKCRKQAELFSPDVIIKEWESYLEKTLNK